MCEAMHRHSRAGPAAACPVNVGAFTRVLDRVIPHTCIACHVSIASDEVICGHCTQSLPFHRDACARCGQRLASTAETCGACLLAPPAYTSCISAFDYAVPVSDWIQQFKFADRPDLARKLAQIFAQQLGDIAEAHADLLVPVPMHRVKLQQRGYNQAALLCKYLAQRLQLKYLLNGLVKTRDTAHQVELTRRQRQQNLRGSFVVPAKTQPLIAGKHIALIDDVLTTGTTASECSIALKHGGAAEISVWTLTHKT